ncbi:MAG: Trp biosynthesis-associated membrane protein [Corynebacteriales bacterium]|nr:Trp biosynthesis-associated membrane protein [Mycobacteriales bacterium]
MSVSPTDPVLTPARAKRELGLAAVLIFVSSALSLYLASRNWWVVQTIRPAPFPPHQETVTGRDFVPWAAAMSFVGMAGAVALFATKKFGRVLVDGVLIVAGVVMAAGGVQGLKGAENTIDVHKAWPTLMLCAGMLVAVGAIFASVRHAKWGRASGMGARFEAAGTTSPETDDDPAHLWDALDRDKDPTSH